MPVSYLEIQKPDTYYLALRECSWRMEEAGTQVMTDRLDWMVRGSGVGEGRGVEMALTFSTCIFFLWCVCGGLGLEVVLFW